MGCLRGHWDGGGTYVDALMREAGRYGRALFFGFAQEDGEILDRGHGDVPAVVAGQEGLSAASVWLLGIASDLGSAVMSSPFLAGFVTHLALQVEEE